MASRGSRRDSWQLTPACGRALSHPSLLGTRPSSATLQPAPNAQQDTKAPQELRLAEEPLPSLLGHLGFGAALSSQPTGTLMARTCSHLGQRHLRPVPTPHTHQPQNHPVPNLHNPLVLILTSLGFFRAILSGWEGSRAPLQKQPRGCIYLLRKRAAPRSQLRASPSRSIQAEHPSGLRMGST